MQAQKEAKVAKKELLDLTRKRSTMAQRYQRKDAKKEGLDDAESRLVAAVHESFKGEGSSNWVFVASGADCIRRAMRRETQQGKGRASDRREEGTSPTSPFLRRHGADCPKLLSARSPRV